MSDNEKKPLPLDPAALRALADLAASQKHLKKAGAPLPEEGDVFIVDADILGTRVPHFRTVSLPAKSTLDAALCAVMDSLGLFPDDPYRCLAKNGRYLDPVSLEQQSDGAPLPDADGKPWNDAEKAVLADALPTVGSTAQLIVGADGGWTVELRLVDTMPAAEFDLPLPCVCLDGDGADVFGEAETTQDYEALCDVVCNPEHPRCQEVRKQLDLPANAPYDEELFDLLEANFRLAEAQVSMAEEHFVPRDPGELREGYKSLLAEVMACECTDLVGIAHMARRFQDLQDFMDSEGGTWEE